MRTWFLAGVLFPLAAAAAPVQQAVEVPPHFTFRDKPHVCSDCGSVREIDIRDRFDERAGKGVLIGDVIGAPVDPVDHGIYYHLTVDMDNGKTRTLNVRNPAGLGVGSRVRLVGSNVEPSG